jgi:hypothetical protein
VILVKGQSKEAAFLRSASVIIVDEAPMAPGLFLEELDHMMREFMGNELTFGGKIVILGGDFRQTLPIVPGGTRDEIIADSIKR